jgi:hypothetical protein
MIEAQPDVAVFLAGTALSLLVMNYPAQSSGLDGVS